MSETYSDTTVFAKLSEDKKQVVEYPVYANVIRNRAHPFSFYTRVVFEPRPEDKLFHSVKETLKVVEDKVYASYEYVPDTLDQVLNWLYRDKIKNTPLGQPVPPLLYSEVDPEIAEIVVQMSDKYVERKMDDFAAIKRYNGIGSACSYATSSISAFKADADKCVDIRDRTLVALYAYLDKLIQGTVAVPKSTADIDAVLPEMTW